MMSGRICEIRFRIIQKIMIVLGLYVIMVVPSAFAWEPHVQKQFNEANKLYAEGKFDKAEAMYQSLAEQDLHSAVIYYNLGNSYFRRGSLAKAILAYERALLYDPRNSDVRDNLNYATSLLEYRVEDKRNWYLRMAEKLLDRFAESEIQLAVAVSCMLLLLSWYIMLAFRHVFFWGWKRKILLAVFIFMVVFLIAKQFGTHVIRDAIIMAKETAVRYGPSDTDRVAFRVGEGIKVYVVDHHEGWSRVWLTNGESGWVKDEHVAEILSKSL